MEEICRVVQQKKFNLAQLLLKNIWLPAVIGSKTRFCQRGYTETTDIRTYAKVIIISSSVLHTVNSF